MFAAPRLVALALSAAALAPTASAGDWGISFGKHGKHGHVSVTLGSPPPVLRRVPAHRCTVEPGHYETLREQVWVAGHTEKVWVPARYETWIDSCGRTHQRLVCPGRYELIQHAGHYEWRTRKVWVPARTTCCDDDRRPRFGSVIRRH